MRLSYSLFALIVIAGVSYGYWSYTHPTSIQVSAVEVERGTVNALVANTRAGTVKACRRAKMSPSLGGQISEIPYPEGSLVKQGDTLLKIWNLDMSAEVAHLQQTVLAATRSAEGSCLQAEEAKRQEARNQKLLTSKSVSRETYDRARTDARVAETVCKAALANVGVADASLKVAEAQLKRTILQAPFDGIVAKINGELNEYVTPSPPGILTPPVIDLIEPGCFLVTIPIDEVDAPRVKPGMAAQVTLDAWRNRVFDARVNRIGAYVVDSEKQARTVDIELKFSNRADFAALLVGYSADAEIILEQHRDVLRIPTETLFEESAVLRFDSNENTLKRTPVEKGISNWKYTEITSGLKPDDLIVTSLGQDGVANGALAELSVKDRSE